MLQTILKEGLSHKKLLFRFLSLFLLVMLIFFLSWTVSYFALPEGVLRTTSGAGLFSLLTASESITTEFLLVFSYNAMALGYIFGASRVLKINSFPLGYLIPLYFAANYGAILGTNSFTTPLPQRLAPSLVFLSRSGMYEIAAYTLMAVSTFGISLYQARGFIPPASEKIRPKPTLKERFNWLGAGLAILILITANAVEVLQLFASRQ